MRPSILTASRLLGQLRANILPSANYTCSVVRTTGGAVTPAYGDALHGDSAGVPHSHLHT